MKISYIKLWKLLLDKRMKKSELRDLVKMSPNTLAKLGKDEMISMDVIVRICQVLKCDIGDIMEVIPEKDDEDGVRN